MKLVEGDVTFIGQRLYIVVSISNQMFFLGAGKGKEIRRVRFFCYEEVYAKERMQFLQESDSVPLLNITPCFFMKDERCIARECTTLQNSKATKA